MLDSTQRVRAAALCAAVAICTSSRSVSAAVADHDNTRGWSGIAGLGVVGQPTYVGGPTERIAPAPLLAVSYRDPTFGTFALDQRGLSWTFLERSNVRLGVIVGSDAGRDARDIGSDPFRSGDDRLNGMGDIESSAEGGVLIGWGPVTLSARKALEERGHAGWVADLSFDWSLDLSDKWGLSMGAGTRWADQKYQQAYFGVTTAQALASRFRSFTPNAGFVQGSVNVGLEYRFTDAWRAQLGVNFQRLVEDALASPVAENPNSTTAVLALTRHFE